VVGYYGVYLGLRMQANKELKQRLDANAYAESETYTLKIPLTLPYQTDWHSFERMDGDFEKDGEFYNLVKRKVERDTLIIVYIKDHKEASLFESLTEFVHASTDTPMSKKASKLIEVFTKDYLSTYSELEIASTGWSLSHTFSQPNYFIDCVVDKVTSPPPKAVI
jgi:hypothetical protein